MKASDGTIVEWVVVDNQPKIVVQEVMAEFFAAGYRYTYMVFGGHGHPDSGRLLLSIPESESEQLPLADRSLSHSEFMDAQSASKDILCGTPGVALINSCYSHLFSQGIEHQHTRGLRVIEVTSKNEPLAPAGGVLQIIQERKNVSLPLPALPPIRNGALSYAAHLITR